MKDGWDPTARVISSYCCSWKELKEETPLANIFFLLFFLTPLTCYVGLSSIHILTCPVNPALFFCHSRGPRSPSSSLTSLGAGFLFWIFADGPWWWTLRAAHICCVYLLLQAPGISDRTIPGDCGSRDTSFLPRQEWQQGGAGVEKLFKKENNFFTI